MWSTYWLTVLCMFCLWLVYPFFTTLSYLKWSFILILTLDKFDNLSKIDKISSPLLIINGKNEEVIPYTHGLQLFQKAKEPKKYLCIDEAMHNNLYDYNIDKEVIKFNS